MKKLTRLPFCLGCVLAVSTCYAVDLKQSKVTQVVNDVQIISAADQQQKAASVNDIFSMPDILRTGPASRAELIAADQTVTRVGANTIFSFDPASRTINLKQGSLLFHSPHGKGGGTIHTGSATASVLGTTLIVTTTPNGGMKVLDLEGAVEVKFLNGLKQKLDPGHMTFVLPGGNQLAPIIVFRLDDLTKNSQLVSGFDGDLSSMPLIKQQIDKQLKAIQDGKLTDTGLEVGDDANSQQVQVIDPNTLQAALDDINSANVRRAFASDAFIDNRDLDSSRIFLDERFFIPGNRFYLGKGFVGFVARNIYFNTLHPDPEIPLSVDIAPHIRLGEFDFVAAGDIVFGGSVNFEGLDVNRSIFFSLIAGDQILVAPGSTIRANVANFEWQSPKTITLDGANVFNDIGNTLFSTGAGFEMKNGAYIQTAANLSVLTPGNITIGHATLGADTIIFTSTLGAISHDTTITTVNSFATFTGDQGVNVSGSTINANSFSGSVAFNSAHGSVNITGTSVQAFWLNINSGDGILLDGNGKTFATTSPNALATFTAKNLADIKNADLSQYKTVNISANTINLHNVAFDGNVSLKSYYGQWHNNTSSFGFVNDLGGNTYHGQAISAADGFSGTIQGTGITVSAR